MKHHLRFKKVIAFVLALTMSVTVLASCEDKDDSSSPLSVKRPFARPAVPLSECTVRRPW